ncbi:hypothetical protein [Kitasatospora sp. NPDC085879]|uniref:hypothetical protein n=1 Tax=Kitasatospora sp. NPDC085879 TaxID=3154769 RepID=UPI0034283C33
MTRAAVLDTERRDSPAIGLSVDRLRGLLAEAERDLAAFLVLAADWATEHVPAHATAVLDALARLVDLPSPATPPTAWTEVSGRTSPVPPGSRG